MPDPASPGAPASGPAPAIPAGWREATVLEIWLWDARADWTRRGGAWSPEVEREMTDHFRAVQATQAAQVSQEAA